MGTVDIRHSDPAASAEDIESTEAWIAAPERKVVRLEATLWRMNDALFDMSSYVMTTHHMAEQLRDEFAEMRLALREGRAPPEAALSKFEADLTDMLTGTKRIHALLHGARMDVRRGRGASVHCPRSAWAPVALSDLVARACLAVRSPLAPEPPVTIPDDVFVQVDPDAFVAVMRRLIEIRCVPHPAPDAPRRPVYLMARVSGDRVSVYVFRQLPASEMVGRPSALPVRREDDPARTQSHMLDWMVMDLGGSPDAPHWGAPESSYAFSLPLAASCPLTP